ncbi:MAG: arginine--tRNA ligase [archaeon]
MDEFRQSIAKALESAIGLKGFDEKTIFGMLESPPAKELGDAAFPAFKLAPLLKKAPKDIAQEIVEKLKLPKEISEAKAIGPYVNFFFSKEALAKDILADILSQKESFGKNKYFGGKKIVVEYSQPNTNKPLHIGHLRNNALAMSAGMLLEKSGAKVKRVDLFNDRGIHICQSMLAYQKWGNNGSPEKEKMKSDHFVGKFYVLYHQKEKELPELKTELQEMLQKWEKGDKKVLVLWKKMNKWAEDGFKKTYKDFGSRFDKRYKESAIYKKAKPIIEQGLKKGIFFCDEKGAVLCDLEKFGLGKKTILREDGTSIYITQDLALAKLKFEDFKFDRSVYVVASEQRTYFLQLFKILELLGFGFADKLFHLSYGLVNLPEGKLKSREGKIVDADGLIFDLTELSRKEILSRYMGLSKKEVEKRAAAIALGAIKFYMLKTDPVKDVLFDPAKAISFDGDSGPYVMYSYARAKSILRKEAAPKKFDAALLAAESEKGILSLLNNFETVVMQSAKGFAPSKLCNYLLELSSAFNTFYHKEPVLTAEKNVKGARLALVKAVSVVLASGLKLLNITPLEEM